LQSDTSEFFVSLANFSQEQGKKLSDFMITAHCLKFGMAAATGLGGIALNNSRKLGPLKGMAFVTGAVAFVVAASVTGGACQYIKSNLASHLAAYNYDNKAAIRGLTPEKKTELAAEARKLLMVIEGYQKQNPQSALPA
jgi:hypothetical protein